MSSRYLRGVDIRILGPIEAYDDETALALGGMRERALLGLFALSPGETVSADRLIDDLWGEDLPANPANALQALVSRLRRSVGSTVIVTRAPGYVLDVDPAAVDAVRFRSMVHSAMETADATKRVEGFREALSLWRGMPLADLPFEEFAQRERAALDELHVSALEGRIAAELELGGGAELVPELEELIAAHPLREKLHGHLMLGLYRAGRQAEALRTYSAVREALGEELGIEPGPELKALEEAILLQDPDLAGSGGSPANPSALPARLASFIGRQKEMSEIDGALRTSRLVTLTGAGGAGKTSLAVEVGRTMEAEYPDRVWLIELAPVVDPDRVADTLVTALQLEQVVNLSGGPAEPANAINLVVEYLRNRRALLILDNCEHVIEAAAAAAEAVLMACPSVEVLATSRDRLGIPGELLWRVPSLDSSSAAVDLFVERARAVAPTFSPDPEDLDLVSRICERVDGMPLAIELAAARVRSLPLPEILRRVESGIELLAGGARSATHRQQTLRGTIDWSYQLLAPAEADLFASLSVFHGSFTLDSAETVAPEKVTEVLDSVERLIDSSMVTPVAPGRYRMLETLRLYAGEKLGDRHDATMGRLLQYYIERMEPAQDELRGSQQLEWLDLIEADHDTMRAVLGWATTNAPGRGLQLAGMLGWFWYLRGNSVEAKSRFESLLAATDEGADPRSLGDGYFFASLCDSYPERARQGFELALEAYRDAGYVPGLANAQAMIAAFGFDLSETIALLDEAAELSAEVGYEWGVALIRFLQTGAAVNDGDTATAARLAQEATSRFSALGDSWGQGYSLYFWGSMLRALGDYDGAEAAFREALEHARPMRLRREMAPVMSELASIETMRGNFDEAERWLADAQKYADEVPFAGSQGMVRNARGRLARMRGLLDDARILHEEALALYEHADAHGGLAYTHSCLGFTAEMTGALKESRAHHQAAMRHGRASGDVFAIALAFEGMGATLIAAGHAEAGVELIGAGLAARDQAGAPLPSGERFDVDRALAVAERRLEPERFRTAMAAGTGIDLDESRVAPVKWFEP